MSDISATRDLVVIGVLAYAAYKLRNPLKDAQDAIGAAVGRAGDIYNFYSTGGELKVAADESDIGQTHTELSDNVSSSLQQGMQDVFGHTAPLLPPTQTVANPVTGEGMQESVEIAPYTPSLTTPVLTPDIEDMIFAPAPNRPPVQIFPPTPSSGSSGSSGSTLPSPVVPSIVPPVTDLISQPSPPSPSSSPSYETQPLDSMTSEEAASGGYSYSGAVGWYR